jgi:RND superfamily putative drug exporter
MRGLARWCLAHRRRVVVGWLAVAILTTALAQAVGPNYASVFSLPGTDSQRAVDLLKREFKAQSGDADTIVFHVSQGTIDSPVVRAAIVPLLAHVGTLPHVAGIVSPYSRRGAVQVSPDRRTAFATVNYDQPANVLANSTGNPVLAQLAAIHVRGLQVAAGGQVIENAEGFSVGPATEVGVVAAMVILLLTFGSLAAAGMPLITAGLGLITGVGLIGLATHVTSMANVSPQLALMIGLGVGIDYALFIVTRFRESYVEFGDVERSVVEAMDTSGRAILLAGATVVIALLGMFATGVAFMYGLAIASVLAVLLVLAASLTLLPALLSRFGPRLVRTRGIRARLFPARRVADAGTSGASPATAPGARPAVAPGARPAVAPGASPAIAAGADGASGGAGRPSAWRRWSRVVQARPWPLAIVSSAVMVALLLPAFAMRLDSSDAGNDPANLSSRHAFDLLANGFGAGFNGPLLLVAELSGPGRAATLPALRAAVGGTPGVVAVTAPRIAPSGRVAVLEAYPNSAPQAARTTDLVNRLRDTVLPAFARQTAVPVLVGGFTAGSIDFSNVLGSKLPLFFGIVILLSVFLLFVIFRSLLIPLQAALMNLLTIGSALGVTVAVFQDGWFAGVLGVQKAPIEAWVPVIMFAVVFGLSMDYEVFLVSRVREQWTRHGDASTAVGDGIALTGRVISAAAAIMVCVFLSFTLGNQRTLKEFGFGLAVAVLLDALVVRCVLLPAVLELLGPRTWWLPRWLDARLPRVNIEGDAARALSNDPAIAPEDSVRLEEPAARESTPT